MLPTGHLLGFAVASFILIVIPGPSVLFVVGRALAYGRRTALATVAGNAAGNYVVAVCVALGIGTLVAQSAAAFTVVKLAGAAYLVWLGAQAFRKRGELAGVLGPARETGPAGETGAAGDACPVTADRAAAPAGGSPAALPGRLRAVRQGFLVGVTNPKALILFGAVLPQFVSRAAGQVPVQMLLLALVSIAIGLTSDSAWGLAASAVRGWFARSPRRFRLVGGAGGLAMIGVGVTVAVTGRST